MKSGSQSKLSFFQLSSSFSYFQKSSRTTCIKLVLLWIERMAIFVRFPNMRFDGEEHGKTDQSGSSNLIWICDGKILISKSCKSSCWENLLLVEVNNIKDRHRGNVTSHNSFHFFDYSNFSSFYHFITFTTLKILPLDRLKFLHAPTDAPTHTEVLTGPLYVWCSCTTISPLVVPSWGLWSSFVKVWEKLERIRQGIDPELW